MTPAVLSLLVGEILVAELVCTLEAEQADAVAALGEVDLGSGSSSAVLDSDSTSDVAACTDVTATTNS